MLAHKIGPGPSLRPGPDESENETVLLARVSAGETQSFRALVDRHLPVVLAIARRMLRDDAEAEDVAQETLLRLWRNAGSLELGEAGVRPWLRRVASNLCIDRVRARPPTLPALRRIWRPGRPKSQHFLMSWSARRTRRKGKLQSFKEGN